MMEVYGQYEEYLTTVRGELLDEIEGSSLYECRIDLKKLQSEILLKVNLFVSVALELLFVLIINSVLTVL